MSNYLAPWKSELGGYYANMDKLEPHISDDVVRLPGGSSVSFKMFRAYRGSGYDVLYWQYTRVGPGVHKTTYTIWNK